jgi:nucleotide-binding universal stress UspA family protein
MLRSLLIGVNGSRWSQAACDIGINWASSLKIPVTCLGVVDVHALAPAEPVPLGAGTFKTVRDEQVLARGRQRIEEALQAASRQAEAAKVECHILQREGSPAALLGEEAQRHDLVILGRRAVPQTDRAPPASETLVDILRHAPRPIVVASQTIPRCSDVVIAYDGSVQASRSLRSYVSSGLYYGHPLHLVGVGNDPQAVQEKLGRAIDFLQAHSLKCEPHVLPIDGTVAETLSGFARRIPAGLLVMGVYGQPWYKEILFGSVTRTMIAQVPVPLFLDH